MSDCFLVKALHDSKLPLVNMLLLDDGVTPAEKKLLSFLDQSKIEASSVKAVLSRPARIINATFNLCFLTARVYYRCNALLFLMRSTCSNGWVSDTPELILSAFLTASW